MYLIFQIDHIFLKFQVQEAFWSWHSNSSHTINPGNRTHIRARELEPVHTPDSGHCYGLHCFFKRAHKQRLSSLSTCFSICHSPAFPSSSFSDLMSSPAQAPLGSTVNCGVCSHSRWKKKKSENRHRPVHTPFKPAHTMNAPPQQGRSQPCSLRLHPDRLPGRRPLRATQLHFLLLFLSPFPLFVTLFLFHSQCTCLGDTPCGGEDKFHPTPTPAFHLFTPLQCTVEAGEGKTTSCTLGLRWWTRWVGGALTPPDGRELAEDSVQLCSSTAQRTVSPSVHRLCPPPPPWALNTFVAYMTLHYTLPECECVFWLQKARMWILNKNAASVKTNASRNGWQWRDTKFMLQTKLP